MTPIAQILLSISGLFLVGLVIKKITKINFCVICASVSITWATLLVLYLWGKFPYPILIAVLMGQSVVGLYYLLDSKVKTNYQVFRLPFLLTATYLVYLVLGLSKGILTESIILLSVWLIFGLLYWFKEKPALAKIFKRVIECCKNW